jgi:hypothetical protein
MINVKRSRFSGVQGSFVVKHIRGEQLLHLPDPVELIRALRLGCCIQMSLLLTRLRYVYLRVESIAPLNITSNMGSRSFVSVQDPAPASLESVSRSPSKLAGLQEDRLEYYKDLRTARFQSHLCNLNRRFQEVVKQPLAFYEEVYQKGDLSPPKLDRLAREIEAAFNGRFPGHPLPPEFHQHQILVNYSIARVGSNVLLIVRLLMEEVKQENGPVIPRYRSTPVVMYHYPNEVSHTFLDR